MFIFINDFGYYLGKMRSERRYSLPRPHSVVSKPNFCIGCKLYGIVANKLDKQLPAADKGDPPALMFGGEGG
jgi:hypothetical protein